MRTRRFLAIVLAFSMVLTLAACGGGKKEETVTVSFDTDGGNSIASQTITKGSAVVKPETPKKTGYIFDKWTLNGSEYQFGTAVNEDITLKAAWVDPNAGKDPEGGSEKPDTSSEEVKCESLSWVNNWYWVQIYCDAEPEINVEPKAAKDKVKFSSSDENVATVSDKGVIYGKNYGNVTITATCGDKKAELEFHVTPNASFYLSNYRVTIDYNSDTPYTDALRAIDKNSNNADFNVKWSSNRPEIVEVDTVGNLYAKGVGVAKVTATGTDGRTAECEVVCYGKNILAYVSGLGQDIVANGITLERGHTYDVSVIEDYFYESGLSKEVYIAQTAELVGSNYIIFSPSDEYHGTLQIPSGTPTGKYSVYFRNTYENFISNSFIITVK